MAWSAGRSLLSQLAVSARPALEHGALPACCEPLWQCLGTAADPAAAGWPAWGTGSSLQQTRGARRVRMVLTKDHPKLGRKGDEVVVKAGYARNQLHPAQEAVYAGPRRKPPQQTPEEASTSSTLTPEAGLDAVLAKLAAAKLVTKRRLSWRLREEERMVGSVTQRHIQALALKQLAVELPRELVLMQQPIERFGEYRIPLNLQDREGRQLELTLTVLKTQRINGP